MALLSPLSVLPTEICLKIISENFRSDEGLVILWTSVRNVSRRWRDLVDDYFRLEHLPRTTIIFSPRHLGRDGYSRTPLENRMADAKFTFDSLSPADLALAVFSDVQFDTPRRVIFPKTLRGVMFYKAYEKLGKDKDVPPWRYPPHIITLRHLANDTEIPGLKIDWVNLRLKCDWRAVFAHLLHEEK
jgi:hypothetical protein